MTSESIVARWLVFTTLENPRRPTYPAFPGRSLDEPAVPLPNSLPAAARRMRALTRLQPSPTPSQARRR
jgi:hypothetical protein